jgi:hypothetical protein
VREGNSFKLPHLRCDQVGSLTEPFTPHSSWAEDRRYLKNGPACGGVKGTGRRRRERLTGFPAPSTARTVCVFGYNLWLIPSAKGVLAMARKTILVSDLSGREVNDKDAAKVTITYSDARKGMIVLDVNASEVADLAAKGTQQKRRGRRPKAA